MRALVLRAAGGVETFEWRNVPDPVPDPGEVVIEVRASGVCHHDVLARRGYFTRTPTSAILGHEIAGTVLATGADVKSLAIGDRVVTMTIWNCGHCGHCLQGREQLCRRGRGVFGEAVSGGYAQRVRAPAHAVIAIPDAVPDTTAAVTPCALGTAHHAVTGLALNVGESVVVTGASGGVGLHAVMLAAAAGLRVIAVTGSPEKTSALSAAGAASVVVADEGHYARSVRAIAPEGAAAVLDPSCAALGESLRCLRAGARVVVLGNISGSATVDLEPALMIMKELGVVSSRGASRAEVTQLLDMIAVGRIKPIVAPARPPEAIPDLHRAIEARAVTGKLVVTW